MPWLIASNSPSTVPDIPAPDGVLSWKRALLTDTTLRELALPEEARSTGTRPSWAAVTGADSVRAYGVGGWLDNIAFTEHFQIVRQGIMPIANPIVSGAGAGYSIGLTQSGTGITGTCIGYVAWYDALHNRWSSLSGPSPTITLTNQGRSWTNLPTAPNDDSVTHIGLFVSMNGATPRLAVIRDLGTTSVVENVATGALGLAMIDDFEKFPRGRYNVIYHDRQAMAGDDRHRDRLYFSVLNEYERYAGFFLRTRNGEPIVGLLEMRDYLVVLCPRSSYVVQGFTEDDIRMDSLERNVGSVSHFANVHVHNIAIVWSHIGPYVCTGTSMHFIGQDFQHLWRREFARHQDAYEASWAVNDVETNVVKLYVGQVDYVSNLTPWLFGGVAMNCYWILDYTPVVAEVGGTYGRPNLAFDVRSRADECAAMLARPDGRRSWLLTGSCDGKVRRENISGPAQPASPGTFPFRDYGNADDNLDLFEKRMRIVTAHYFPAGPGGSTSDGRQFPTLWLFRESPDNSGTLRLKCGDEQSIEHFEANREITVDSGAGTTKQTWPYGGAPTDPTNIPLAPETVFFCEPWVSGRGITIDYEIILPYAPVWRGFGFNHMPGETERIGVTPPLALG